MIQVDRHTMIQVLGSLMQKPEIFSDVDKYCFDVDQFNNPLDRYIYSAMLKRINNPAEHRLLRSHLESVDLGDLLKSPIDMNCYLHVEAPTGEDFYKVFWTFFRASGLTDPEVYNSCNMGRDTFWRIVNNKNDGINKKTAVQLCFGLKLSYEDILA